MSGVTLSAWLLSAVSSQLLWLHVEIEHRGHDHEPHSHGLAFMAFQPAEHEAHDHDLTTARGPVLPSQRPQVIAPTLCVSPLEWRSAALDEAFRAATIPSPRGSPQRQTILQI